jgi:ubiquinone/menaquinone biosynthesis C-methylase UbiE
MGATYDEIGLGYNQTRKADAFLTERHQHHLCLDPKGTYLDVGCGTGNYTIALQQKGLPMTGIDPSEEMLKVARAKNGNIGWIKASAEEIPLAGESTNGIICHLTIHHWHDLTSGFQELHRVLKPNGRIVVFTSTPTQMKGYWLNHYFPRMLKDAICQMPSKDIVCDALAHAGLQIVNTAQYSVKSDLSDMFLYAGKHQPSIYLNPAVRNGISSFASLANVKEVSRGLTQLERDIASGKISSIIEAYSNDLGDYLYIIAEKKGDFDAATKPSS